MREVESKQRYEILAMASRSVEQWQQLKR